MEITRFRYLNDYNDVTSWQPLTDDPDNFVSLGAFGWVGDDISKAHSENPGLVGIHKSLCVQPDNVVKWGFWWLIPSQDGTLYLDAFASNEKGRDTPRPEYLW